MKITILSKFSILVAAISILSACQQDQQEEVNLSASSTLSLKSAKVHSQTITIENVLDAKPLVESGTFQGAGTPPVIFPGQEISFNFSAGKGQYLSFATMYGWSNDLFFAPENPGIKLYDDDGMPIEGDVSWEVKLWDNGTRENQVPGMDVMHPGTLEDPVKQISEVNGMDDYGNTYPAASDMMKVWLTYNDDSTFTITIMNDSNNTSNPTPFSPGVWTISYAPGGNLLMPEPIYQDWTTEGLTNIAEAGNITVMNEYIQSETGIFTPLSPILVVVYKGDSNPFYKVGEYDWDNGLKNIAQFGDASILAANLMEKPEVQDVYILDANGGPLLPRIDGNPGSKVSQELWVTGGSKIAIATMYGLSNDWFFATKGQDVNALRVGDISSTIGLFDDGTGVNEFPGAGVNQAAFGGTPVEESNPIMEVANPNGYTTLPQIIKVTLERPTDD
ncbi:spondin domain-containing protein [Gaetbulibacter sp. M235]|uniref:spondin domain-containing protein n=1 Tax=Gaetbulibacter sp. M235 TaxID=3126510 RepID=UPI00374FA5AA